MLLTYCILLVSFVLNSKYVERDNNDHTLNLTLKHPKELMRNEG